ncbi:MAG: hypothetical protein WBI06_09990 [Paludibacter sp.]
MTESEFRHPEIPTASTRLHRVVNPSDPQSDPTVMFNRQQSGMPEFRLRQQKTISPHVLTDMQLGR